MTEDDYSVLITSIIDENDIEILESIDNDFVEPVNFVPDVHPTSFIRQESEEFEDETLVERLYGLTEMFPNWLQRLIQSLPFYSKSIGQCLGKTLWFCSSSFIVLILPILVQQEFIQINEFQSAQTRQILLGPTAQINDFM